MTQTLDEELDSRDHLLLTPAFLNDSYPISIAFGPGIHFWIGAPLARLESPIALSANLNRMPNLRLAKPVEWNSGVMRSIQALRVEI
jgi:hypothetical protein